MNFLEDLTEGKEGGFFDNISESLKDLMSNIKEQMEKLMITFGLKKKETIKQTTEDLNALKEEILGLTTEDETKKELTDKEKVVRKELNENNIINKYMSGLKTTKTTNKITLNKNVIKNEKTEMVYSIKHEINEGSEKLTEQELKEIIESLPDITKLEKDEVLVTIINTIDGKYTMKQIIDEYDKLEKDDKTTEDLTTEILNKLGGITDETDETTEEETEEEIEE